VCVNKALRSTTADSTFTFEELLRLLCLQPWYDYLPSGRLDLSLHAYGGSHSEALAAAVKREAVDLWTGFSNVSVEELKTHLMGLFRLADENGDGVLEPKEFKHLLEISGLDSTLFEGQFKTMDPNGDGLIDYTEFIRGACQAEGAQNALSKGLVAESLDPALMDTYLRSMFAAADINGDGVLQPSEIKRLCGMRMSQKQLSELMQVIDVNQDGVVEYAEFVKMASQLLKARFSMFHCLEILRNVWYWLEEPLPKLLDDLNEGQAINCLTQFCFGALGFSRQCTQPTLDINEILQCIQSDPWRSYLPDAFKDKSKRGSLRVVSADNLESFTNLHHGWRKSKTPDCILGFLVQVGHVFGSKDMIPFLEWMRTTAARRMCTLLNRCLMAQSRSTVECFPMLWFAELVCNRPWRRLISGPMLSVLQQYIREQHTEAHLDPFGIIPDMARHDPKKQLKIGNGVWAERLRKGGTALISIHGHESGTVGLPAKSGPNFGGKLFSRKVEGSFVLMLIEAREKSDADECRVNGGEKLDVDGVERPDGVGGEKSSAHTLGVNSAELNGNIAVYLEDSLSFPNAAELAAAAGAIAVVMVQGESNQVWPQYIPIRPKVNIPCVVVPNDKGMHLQTECTERDCRPTGCIKGVIAMNLEVIKQIYDRYHVHSVKAAATALNIVSEVLQTCRNPLNWLTVEPYSQRALVSVRRWMKTVNWRQLRSSGLAFSDVLQILQLNPWRKLVPSGIQLEIQDYFKSPQDYFVLKYNAEPEPEPEPEQRGLLTLDAQEMDQGIHISDLGAFLPVGDALDLDESEDEFELSMGDTLLVDMTQEIEERERKKTTTQVRPKVAHEAVEVEAPDTLDMILQDLETSLGFK